MVNKYSADWVAAQVAASKQPVAPSKIERLAMRHEVATDKFEHCLAKVLFWAGRLAAARKTLRTINKALGRVDCDDVEMQHVEADDET